jgi:hypothetical protein
MRTASFLAVFSAAVAVAGCGSTPANPNTPIETAIPSNPGPPDEQPTGPQPDFIVTRGMNVVTEGQAAQFSVIAFRRATVNNAYVLGIKQEEIILSGVWFQILNPGMALIRGSEVIGRTSGSTTLRTSYHGRDYDLPFFVARPNQAAATFARTWTGIGVRYCNDFFGNTRSCYPDYDGTVRTSTMDMTLTLMNTGGVITGGLQLGGKGWTPLSGPVNGGVDEQGRLVLGGFVGSDSHGINEQLRDWRFTLSGSQLTGTGVLDHAFVNIYGPVLHRVTFSSITLTPQ